MRTKKEKKRLFLISFIIIGLLSFLVATVYKDFMTVMDNKNQASILKSEYEQLLDEEKSLSSEVTKMQDPDYLARYAKEKFLYSKDDEVIIRID